MTIAFKPEQKHRCRPPRYRPESEWRRMPVPVGWRPKNDRDKEAHFTMPTAHDPGTVWVCGECAKGWIRRLGHHYGRNPAFGWTEGGWTRVPWFGFRIRRRIKDHLAQLAYERDRSVVENFVLP